MDNSEKLARLKILIPEEKNEEILTLYLDFALDIILSKRFPFGNESKQLEPKYHNLQLQIAVELYNKRGAEGENSHSENGISRSYENAGVSASLLCQITPYCEVFD